jgi:hypothetical protein
MKIVLNPESGASGGSGGAAPVADSANPSPQPNPVVETKTVSWDNHQRALADLHKFKADAEKLRTQLGDQESERLKAANDYKGLYEAEKAKRETSDKKLVEFTGWTLQTQRFNEVKHLALADGLKKEALGDLELIDLDDVKVESTSTGRFIVQGAKDRVEKLKTERPHWFSAANAPQINSGGGGGAPAKGAKLTVNDVVEAERNWKRNRITRQAYDELYNRYLKENPRNATPTEASAR